MRQVCKYDPDCDLCQVDQFGFVDIVKSNATSKVDPIDSLQEVRFNQINDPRSVGERASDEFELMQQGVVVSEYKAPDKDNVSE